MVEDFHQSEEVEEEAAEEAEEEVVLEVDLLVAEVEEEGTSCSHFSVVLLYIDIFVKSRAIVNHISQIIHHLYPTEADLVEEDVMEVEDAAVVAGEEDVMEDAVEAVVDEVVE